LKLASTWSVHRIGGIASRVAVQFPQIALAHCINAKRGAAESLWTLCFELSRAT
jgi:hypothetical protein